MNFEFATAARIVFGPGALAQAGGLAAALGQRALLAVGTPAGAGDPAALAAERAAGLVERLAAAGVHATLFPVSSEPTIDLAEAGSTLARQEACDLVIGFGGGSALDTAKAVAALLTNPGEVLDYLEVVGRGRELAHPAAPSIAIPTTAGTGAEVTRNAVLGVPAQQVKVSLRSASMLPRVALVDPELTYSLPPQVTASTGLDALTQLIEPYVSNRANPLTDAICREGMARAAHSLLRAYDQGDDREARQDMALASLFGGLALANARLGAVHGFAGPLGGLLDAPHGAICAALLPHVMEANLQALQARDPGNPVISRYIEVARLLTGSPQASAQDGVAWVKDLVAALQVSRLALWGLKKEDFAEVVDKSARASSMQGNPIKLNADELAAILEQAY